MMINRVSYLLFGIDLHVKLIRQENNDLRYFKNNLCYIS